MCYRFLLFYRLLAAFFDLFTRYPDYYPDGGNYIQKKEQHKSKHLKKKIVFKFDENSLTTLDQN